MAAISRAGWVNVVRDADPQDWVAALRLPGPERDAALRRVHALLLRAARHQLRRMRSLLADVGAERAEEIANQVADEALVVLLTKLSTFEGRSRFTTWAYKFAILQTSTEVRRYAWRDREVPLETSIPVVAADASPEQYAEAAELAATARFAIEHALSPHQRSVTIALLVDDVPIDVLANG